MMKSGAPPDKFVGLYRMFTYRVPWFSQAEIIVRVITLWFLVLFQFFRDGTGPFNFKLQSTSRGIFSDRDDTSFCRSVLLLSLCYNTPGILSGVQRHIRVVASSR